MDNRDEVAVRVGTQEGSVGTVPGETQPARL
jgi:hypothetical protein